MIRSATSAGRSGAEGPDQQLEADVMRFVAIIALCIVAISTLVDDTPPPAPVVVDEPESVPAATAPRVPSPPMVAAPPASPPESASARAGGAVAITSTHGAATKTTTSPAPPQPAAGDYAPDIPESVDPVAAEAREDNADRDDARAIIGRASAGSESVRMTAARRRGEEPLVPAPAVTGGSTVEPTAREAAAVADAAREPAAPEPAVVESATPESRVVESRVVEPSPAEPESGARTDADPQPVAPPPDSRPNESGFTLRFASDAALLRLVGRGEAGLYVFDGGATLRLDYGPNGAAFAPATGPDQYHEIAAATVPDLLRRTLAGRGRRSADVVWGVTLPSSTRSALARLISDHRSGALVIDERGRVRLETHHDRT